MITMLLLLISVDSDWHSRHIIPTDHGTIRACAHIWTPSNIQWSTAGIVLFVHGHTYTADSAWQLMNLHRQWKQSKRNAIFLVIDAPPSSTSPILHDSLKELLWYIEEAIGTVLPPGPIVTIAHSGGYRTAVRWLTHNRLRHVILLDAFYGSRWHFDNYVARKHTKLVLVSKLTRQRCLKFLQVHFFRRLLSIPKQWKAYQRRARILHIETSLSHHHLPYSNAMVRLLQRTALKVL